MGSYMNSKNLVQKPQNQATSLKPAAGTQLVRQSSIYNLTFEELQNSSLGSGKEFGSMNMDEFVKNLWNVEETQETTLTVAGQGNLQGQISLTLPRTFSQKTVDDVLKELFKENSGVKDVIQQQKQPTLGEITLEDFLSRAGVVREDNDGYYGGESSQLNNNMTVGFQQSAPNNVVMGDRTSESSNIVPNQWSSLTKDMSGIRPSQQTLPQSFFSNQANVNFTSSMQMTNDTQPFTQLPPNQCVYRTGIAEPLPAKQSVYRSGAKMGSPLRSNGDMPSVSPPSYMLGEVGLRRKNGTMEKATERRHKRMIKNRESAARSRARKQAYTFELEAEIVKLKETNHELRQKQDEIMKMQFNEATDKKKMPWGNKRRCLRRTLTGPW